MNETFQANGKLFKMFRSIQFIQTLSFTDGSTSDISASVIQAIPFQARNYHKSVSENKEIVKLVSVLSTSISSTKKVHVLSISTRNLIKHASNWPNRYRTRRNKLNKHTTFLNYIVCCFLNIKYYILLCLMPASKIIRLVTVKGHFTFCILSTI